MSTSQVTLHTETANIGRTTFGLAKRLFCASNLGNAVATISALLRSRLCRTRAFQELWKMVSHPKLWNIDARYASCYTLHVLCVIPCPMSDRFFWVMIWDVLVGAPLSALHHAKHICSHLVSEMAAKLRSNLERLLLLVLCNSWSLILLFVSAFKWDVTLSFSSCKSELRINNRIPLTASTVQYSG